MKQFMNMKLILLLKESSLLTTGAGDMENAYDKFACFLFAKSAAAVDLVALQNSLNYIHAELTGLQILRTGVLKKKRVGRIVPDKSDFACQQAT
jgi:hypothetical protein